MERITVAETKTRNFHSGFSEAPAEGKSNDTP